MEEHEVLPPFNPTEYFREMIFMTDFFNESDQLPMQMCDDGAAQVDQTIQQSEELFGQPAESDEPMLD